MLRVPVVSAVGHERDSTLIDDVAAVACSTPTHAAEAAVPLDCLAARARASSAASSRCGGRGRARSGPARRHLAALARGPARALQRERGALNQKTREIRAASERGLAERRAPRSGAIAPWSSSARAGAAPPGADTGAARREALRRAAVALRAHDPERTLERGYALAEDADGEPVTSAAAARAAERISLRFADGRVRVETEERDEREA